MAAETATQSETTAQIIRLVRFAIGCTLGLAAALLLADLAGRGWATAELRFCSEKVLMTVVSAIAVQVLAAIAAVTSLTLWK